MARWNPSRRSPLTPILALGAALLAACGGGDSGGGASGGAGSAGGASAGSELKVLQLPMRTDGPKSLDPVKSSTQYENRSIVNMMDGLLQYKYLARPLALEPALLVEMPKISDDGLTWTCRLKEGVRFHDDECFGGKPRTVRSEDVFYSWKRIADPAYKGKSWWLMENTIVGFDQYRDEQTALVEAGGEFDYDAPVEGMRVIDELNFELKLQRRIERFKWVLAMPQLVIVPREAVEHYGKRWDRNVVGTGPFMLEEWEQGKSLTMVRNPHFREEFYPDEHEPGDVERGFTAAAGQRLPFVDRIEITMYPEDQPMWLQFSAGKLDYTQCPDEYFRKAVDARSRKLKREYAKKGITYNPVPLLDFIFYGFNMEDEVLGGFGEKATKIRQAIAYAIDWEERNETFYSKVPTIYDGMIPPGLPGHPEGHKAPISYRPQNLEKARQLLAEAGYSQDNRLQIDYYTSRGSNIPEQVEMFKRWMGAVGIDVNDKLLDFSQLIAAIDAKQAQMFSFAWGTDYPDPENNLALFYGPNESPGSNHFNYKRDEYDRMYEQIQTMYDSPERTAIMERMRDMVLEDCAFVGSQARARHYFINPWMKNFKPSEDFFNWLKYIDLDTAQRPQG